MDVSEHIKRATEDVGEDEEKIVEQRLEYEGETLAVLEDELDQRIYQSTIFKLSKYLKHWRERRLVLTPHALGAFEVKGELMAATEWVLLKTVKACWAPAEKDKHDPKDKFVFVLIGNDKNAAEMEFRFACSTVQERDKWIALIKQQCQSCTE